MGKKVTEVNNHKKIYNLKVILDLNHLKSDFIEFPQMKERRSRKSPKTQATMFGMNDEAMSDPPPSIRSQLEGLCSINTDHGGSEGCDCKHLALVRVHAVALV